MQSTEKLVDTIIDAVDKRQSKKAKSYDTPATVTRVEGSTAYVHIPGGVDETPASLTVNAKKGDTVQVRVGGGKAWLVGNASAPPTDNAVANAAIARVAATEEIVATKADIVDLRAVHADIDDLEADTAKIHDLTAEELSATVGYIGDLTADEITAQDISAATGYVGDLTAGNVTAQNLIADHGTIGSLNSNYARINAANITESATQNAWINQLLVNTGLLAHSGTIYTLDAIQVNASNITAGTIDVERLIVTVNNEKYLVHIDTSTGTPTYEKLDGDVIEDLTITADKIVAGAITADKITTNNLVGTNGWINLHSGTFFYGDGADWASCTQGIKWDGTSLLVKGALTVTSGSNVYTKAEADQMNLDASKVATNYLTFDSTNGLDVGASGLSSKVNIKSDGVRIYDGSGNLGNYVSAGGTSIYKGTSLKASYGDEINLYGGSSSSGANPKVNVSSTALQLIKDSTHFARVNSDGMQVFSGSSSKDVANFGTSVRIGPTNSSYMTVDSNGLTFKKNNTSSSFYAGRISFNTDSSTAQKMTLATGSVYTIYTSNSTTKSGSLELFGGYEKGARLTISGGSSSTVSITADATNFELSLDTSAASTTTDGALYAAINALGWASAVID